MRPAIPAPSPISRLTTLLLSAAVVSGCGGGGGGGGPTPPELSVADSLRKFGIDTSPTPRLGDDKQPLPNDYTPVARKLEVERLSELYIAGLEPLGKQNIATLLDDNGQTEILALTAGQAPWLAENVGPRPIPTTLRDVTSADIDADGLDEIVTVYFDGSRLRLNVRDDAGAAFAETNTVLGAENGVLNVAIVAGDFNADGREDLVVGVVGDVRKILFVQIGAGTTASIDHQAVLGSRPSGRAFAMRLAMGNIDDDGGEELVVVENAQDTPSSANEESLYYVFDDATAGFSMIEDPANPGHFVQGETGEPGKPPARLDVTDACTGDLDGDGRDEILLGGLENLDNDGTFEYVLIALDDFEGGRFKQLAIETFDFGFQVGRGANLRFVHLNCLDIDGDGGTDIQFGHFVFKLERDALVRRYRMRDRDIFPEIPSSASTYWYDISTSSVAVGDVTGDGRDDVITVRQGSSVDSYQVYVYGFDVKTPIPAPGVDVPVPERRSIPIKPAHTASGSVNPILACANVDRDSRVLRYIEGSYRLSYTEPIVIAAIAAPPCIEGIGQNGEACVSEWGNSSTTGSELERSVSVSVSASIGLSVKDPVTDSGIELKAELSTVVTGIESSSYSVTRSLIYTSGGNENTVIFTTVPMDQYSYEVVSHPDRSEEGRVITVNLPRTPRTIGVSQSFYNDNLPQGGIAINDRVFGHRTEDARSYPSPQTRDEILAGSVNGRGVMSKLASVGEGEGTDAVSLEIAQHYGTGEALALGFSVDVGMSAGPVLAGVSVGVTGEETLSVFSGTQSSYSGTVGRIPARNFAANQYPFGLFTYVQSIAGQQFEVVNYWVE